MSERTIRPSSARAAVVRRAGTASVLSLALGLLLAVQPTAAPIRAQPAAEATGGSSVTVTGRNEPPEDFSPLEITVSQTRDLVNQAVVVSWRNAAPTPRDRFLGVDYLQVMQCWGDPDDPTDERGLKFRETCQFGVRLPAPAIPNNLQISSSSVEANSRAVLKGLPGYPSPDPQENPQILPPDARMVPFRSVNGERSRDGSAAHPYRLIPDPALPSRQIEETDVDVVRSYFSEGTTNEYPYALTSGDGTGRIAFEVQNAALAPHLGCGAPYTDGQGVQRPARPCSLVIVPRGSHHPYTGTDISTTDSIHGSPFTPALWKHRIVVPLRFAPVGGYCPIGKAERRTAGTELVAEAVSSWQPAVCANNGPVIGYSAIGDPEANRQVLLPNESAPGLVFTADPVKPGPADPAVVHAPVALSGVVIGLNVDANIVDPSLANGTVPADVLRQAGAALRDLKLTPRLVAKLLTQSYVNDVSVVGSGPDGNGIAGNPRSIRYDKEFLTLNPIFNYWDRAQAATLDGLMVSVGNSAAARDVWRWILGDPEARTWLSGQADENGMVVNRFYRGLASADLDNFPKPDPKCYEQEYGGETYRHCSLDLRPYLGSFGETAVQTLRADSKGKSRTLNVFGDIPKWDPLPRRSPGFRFAMSVTDSASAARYGLFSAALCKPKRDGAGKLVAPDDCRLPTTEAVDAAVRTAVPSGVAGVRLIDPVKAWQSPGAYPLSMLTYAVGDTSESPEARRDYAALLRYAAGLGQVLGVDQGQLPEGYVPLPQELRTQALAAAGQLERARSSASTSPSPANTGPAMAPPARPGQPPAPSGVPSRGSVPSPGNTAASPAPAAQPAGQATPGSPIGAVRYLLVGVLVLGLVGGVAGPVLRRLAARKRAT